MTMSRAEQEQFNRMEKTIKAWEEANLKVTLDADELRDVIDQASGAATDVIDGFIEDYEDMDKSMLCIKTYREQFYRTMGQFIDDYQRKVSKPKVPRY